MDATWGDAGPLSSLAAAVRLGATRRNVLAVGLAAVGIFVAAAAGVHPIQIVAPIFVIALGVVVVRWPEVALLLAVALIPFNHFAYLVMSSRFHVPLQPYTYWKDALVAGVLARAAWTRVRADGLGWLTEPVIVAVVAYTVALLVAASASPSPVAAGYEMETLLLGPALLLAIVALRPSRRVVIAGAVTITAVGAVMAALGVFDVLNQGALPKWMGLGSSPGGAYSDGSGGYRAGSLFGGPPPFSFFMLTAVTVSIAVAAGLARGARARAVATAAVALGLAGLTVAFTRSAFVGAAVAIPLSLALAVRPRRIGGLLALMVVVLFAGIVTEGVARGDSRIVHTVGDNSAHLDRIEADLDLISQYPLGLGLGQTDYIGQRFDADPIAGIGGSTESFFFARGVEGGMASLLTMLVLVFVMFMRVRRSRIEALFRGDRFAIALGAAAMCAVIGYSLAGLTLPLPPDTTLFATVGLALVVGTALPRTQTRVTGPAAVARSTTR